jgi:hypothetical protein
VVLLVRVLFDVEVEFVRRVLVVGVAVELLLADVLMVVRVVVVEFVAVWVAVVRLLRLKVLVVELATVDVDVVFFAIMTVPDVVLLVALELLVVDAVGWLVEVDVVGELTRVDELVVVEPGVAVELIVARVVRALEVSLVREVELAAV